MDRKTNTVSGAFPKREKKKAETRQKIVDASIELFLERSHGLVTLEDVAERAGIHVQTLYRHFPNKASLMLAGDELWVERFKNFIAQQDDHLDTFKIWREWLNFAYKEIVENPTKYKALYQRKIESDQAMIGWLRIQHHYEDLLTECLAQDFEMSDDGVTLPRLVAGMLMSGNASVIRRFTEGETDFMSEVNATIDLVEGQFGHLVVEKRAPRTA